MRAVQLQRHGGPDVLELRDVPAPEPLPGYVTIRVAYAGITFADTKFRRGEAPAPLPFTPGLEVTGHIEALGAGVNELAVGQAVAALTVVQFGGYAEIVMVDANLVVPLTVDSDDTLVRVCGAPVNTTAAIVALAQTRVPARVLVHGATSGVGSQIGQVAKLLGAQEVVGTVRTAERANLGAAARFDQIRVGSDWLDEAHGDQWSLIFDPIGGAIRQTSLQRLLPGGTLVLLGNASRDHDIPFSAAELFRTSRTVTGFSLGALAALDPEAIRPALVRAVQWATDGDVETDIERVHDLAEVVDVHKGMDAGTAKGKHLLSLRG